MLLLVYAGHADLSALKSQILLSPAVLAGYPLYSYAGEAQERSNAGTASTSTAPRAPERTTQAVARKDARYCDQRS